MIRYTLVYATPVHRSLDRNVILVEKSKPDWQRGRLNLPGGKVEPGETPLQCANRELLEETGISACDSKLLGVMKGDGWMIHVAWAGFRGDQIVRQGPDEPVHELPLRVALTAPRLIPNLLIVIPLCDAQVAGWTMIEVAATVWEVRV